MSVAMSSALAIERRRTRAAWSVDSVMHATAPESDRIHSTCPAELVSYTGTITAPA